MTKKNKTIKQAIQFQRSRTKGAKPTRDQLKEGEIAINLKDKKIFTNDGQEIISIGGSSSGASEYVVVSGAVTAEANKGYLLDTETEKGVISLPPAEEISNGTSVSVGDWNGHALKNHIEIEPNDGQTVMGKAEKFILDVGYAVITLVYIESVKDWRIVGGVGESAQISDGVPLGTIVLFAKEPRKGYLALDGRDYPNMAQDYPQFYDYWGSTTLPDWRDKVVKMAGEDLAALEQKGWCIPSHTHGRGTQNITGAIEPCVGDPDSAWIPVSYGSGAFKPSQVNGQTHPISHGGLTSGLNYGIYFDASRNWTGTSSAPEGLKSGQVGESNEVDRVGAIYAIKVCGRVDDEGLASMAGIRDDVETLKSNVDAIKSITDGKIIKFNRPHYSDWVDAPAMADKTCLGGWHGRFMTEFKTGYLYLGMSNGKLDLILDGDVYTKDGTTKLIGDTNPDFYGNIHIRNMATPEQAGRFYTFFADDGRGYVFEAAYNFGDDDSTWCYHYYIKPDKSLSQFVVNGGVKSRTNLPHGSWGSENNNFIAYAPNIDCGMIFRAEGTGKDIMWIQNGSAGMSLAWADINANPTGCNYNFSETAASLPVTLSSKFVSHPILAEKKATSRRFEDFELFNGFVGIKGTASRLKSKKNPTTLAAKKSTDFTEIMPFIEENGTDHMELMAAMYAKIQELETKLNHVEGAK